MYYLNIYQVLGTVYLSNVAYGSLDTSSYKQTTNYDDRRAFTPIDLPRDSGMY